MLQYFLVAKKKRNYYYQCYSLQTIHFYFYFEHKIDSIIYCIIKIHFTWHSLEKYFKILWSSQLITMRYCCVVHRNCEDEMCIFLILLCYYSHCVCLFEGKKKKWMNFYGSFYRYFLDSIQKRTCVKIQYLNGIIYPKWKTSAFLMWNKSRKSLLSLDKNFSLFSKFLQ